MSNMNTDSKQEITNPQWTAKYKPLFPTIAKDFLCERKGRISFESFLNDLQTHLHIYQLQKAEEEKAKLQMKHMEHTVNAV